MNLAFLALLPAALLIDRLFGELPSRVHPVCMMGALASRIEALFRRGSNNALMSLSGTLACLLVVLPCAALAGGLAWAAQVYDSRNSNASGIRAKYLARAAWFVSAIIIWICVAPRSLDEHALRVAVPLAKGDLEGARDALSRLSAFRKNFKDGSRNRASADLQVADCAVLVRPPAEWDAADAARMRERMALADCHQQRANWQLYLAEYELLHGSPEEAARLASDASLEPLTPRMERLRADVLSGLEVSA